MCALTFLWILGESLWNVWTDQLKRWLCARKHLKTPARTALPYCNLPTWCVHKSFREVSWFRKLLFCNYKNFMKQLPHGNMKFRVTQFCVFRPWSFIFGSRTDDLLSPLRWGLCFFCQCGSLASPQKYELSISWGTDLALCLEWLSSSLPG